MRSAPARAGLFGLLANSTLVLAFVPVPGRWRGLYVNKGSRPLARPDTRVCSSGSSSSSSSSNGGGPVEAQASKKSNANAAIAQDNEILDWLASNAGVRTKKVSLGATAGGRGLVSDEDVQEGQVLLEVPSDACLWSTRDGVVTGLLGQTDLCWEAAGDLREPVSDEDFARGMTWDVRLALALHEATSDPQIGGKFWSVYGRLLPQPHTVTVPFCLPERLLAQLHNDGMMGRARKQVERMRALYPDLMQTLLSHPKTAIYVAKKADGGQAAAAAAAKTKDTAENETDLAPMALLWAFAMVRSRAFAAGDHRFAFVPFLDMANHGFAEPTANFTYDGAVEPGVFRLQAVRNMSAGHEVTISYGEKLNAEQLMVQYGFPVPSTVPLERPLCDSDALNRDSAAGAAQEKATAAVAAAAAEGGPTEGQDEAEGVTDVGEGWGQERVVLMSDLFLRAQQRLAREAGGDELHFEMGVRKLIPLIPPIATKIGELRGDGEDAITQGAETYLRELQAYRSTNFPSTEKQDRELLSYCLGDGRGKVDPRLADVVRYRLSRKEAHSAAVDILEEFLTPPPPAPPAPATINSGEDKDQEEKEDEEEDEDHIEEDDGEQGQIHHQR
ncbi:unnamed protein product [Pylaiella littoralis]